MYTLLRVQKRLRSLRECTMYVTYLYAKESEKYEIKNALTFL